MTATEPAADAFPKFRLVRFNPRRMHRSCSGAAEVEVVESASVSPYRLWLTRTDVEKNIIEFGRHPGLVDALKAYRNGVEILEPTP